ncbi:acryloyl-CoA reductase [bacterium]|nr:MAG: acryloyl-CoA reductase [bacterium]
MELTYKALVSEGDGNGTNSLSLKELSISDLPKNDVLIRVHYSSLNYKDALCAKGHKGITRAYPHTPGIDASGIVVEDSSRTFKPGTSVIATSYDIGMNTQGGFGEYISVPAQWVHLLPDGLSLRESMILGTAGFTAALAIWKAEKMGMNSGSTCMVTGATGGVGLWAVVLLNHLGFRVHASTGKTHLHDFLIEHGVKTILSREELSVESPKPLLPTQFDWAIDTVGGKTLENLIKKTEKEGVIAICGNVTGNELNTSVFPQILRGVSLLGIDSGHIGYEARKELWENLATDWKVDFPEKTVKEVQLEQLAQEVNLILSGQQFGRVLINHLNE